MKESTITFKNLNIDPALYFTGTNEEIEAAERKEAERATELEAVITSPLFIAAEYTHASGAREILHHSTRRGILYQLSYIAADNVPTMHENYIRTGEPADHSHIGTAADLYRHFINYNIDEDITIRLLTA